MLPRQLSRLRKACSEISRTKHHFQPAQMMLQLLDDIVRKGIVYINMAREQERGITRFF